VLFWWVLLVFFSGGYFWVVFFYNNLANNTQNTCVVQKQMPMQCHQLLDLLEDTKIVKNKLGLYGDITFLLQKLNRY